MQKIKIVITNGSRWDYYQWFLLGFYLLERAGKVDVEIDTSLFQKLVFSCVGKYRLVEALVKRIGIKLKIDSYNLDGYVEDEFGNKKYFTIDSADSPFLFSQERLENVDAYFKMQCPLDVANDEGFPLTDEIFIPWYDHQHTDPDLCLTERGTRRKLASLKQYVGKIQPLMIGPRKLAYGNRFKDLDKGYKRYVSAQHLLKTKKLMCYFGDAHGPGSASDLFGLDPDSERSLMGYFDNRIEHPNEKRAKAADMIASVQKYDTDARVIHKGPSDSGRHKASSQFVPLKDFCAHVAGFQYNLNISGYRRSIPNRFIESFMVGTKILTDRLAVRWYRPFTVEVQETVPMGYLRDEQVDWRGFQYDLDNLPEAKSKQIVETFRRNWAPEVVAQYILDTVLHS